MRLSRVTDHAPASVLPEIEGSNSSCSVNCRIGAAMIGDSGKIAASNPAIHETTTGPEIWDDTDGALDFFVSGVGAGVSRYIKRTRGKPIQSVAVEPEASRILTQQRAGLPLQPGPHKIQGIGAGFIPDALDLSLIDAVEHVSNEEAIHFARRLAREEGILAGISSGAAVAAAARLAKKPENTHKTIVVILPDSGERYLSSVLFEGVFDAQGLAAGLAA